MSDPDNPGPYEEDKGRPDDDKVIHLGKSKRRPPTPETDLLTEQRVMRMFVEAHKDELRFNHDTRKWLIWHNHRWRVDRKQRVFEMALDLCRSLAQSATLHKIRFARAVEEAARSQREFATVSDNWDADPWLIGTPGGTVDLKTGDLRAGRPEDMISKVTACAPSKTADCPRWRKFLAEALEGKADNIAFFQRFCGYALTGLTREEMLLFLAGKPGTGKGTATKILLSILRDYALTVPVAMLTDAGWRALEYYRAKLPGKRLILASEPEKGSTWSDAFVNELTGSDRLSGREPRGEVFDFDPTHKLAIHGEQVPELKSVATGLRRRLGILPFNSQPAQPDPNLKEALKAEQSGVFRWLIDGCLEWQSKGLNPPSDVKAAVDEYFSNQDTVARWLDDCCEAGPTVSERPGVLLGSYNNWAARNNEKRMTFSQFHSATKNRFPRFRLHGSDYCRGITLKSQKADEGEDE